MSIDRSEYNRDYNKAWREANKDKVASRNKNYREAHKEKIAEYKRAYYQANKEKIGAKNKAWEEANKEANKKRIRDWRAKNRGRRNALEAKRYTAKLNRTPCWLTEADFGKIERKYEYAQRKTETTGERWVVDHIIPLQGVVVSGLHVPANLRVIKNSTNCRKRNHFDLEKEWALP